jgi:hypothetical protein
MKRFWNLLKDGQTNFDSAISKVNNTDNLKSDLSREFHLFIERLKVIDLKWGAEDDYYRKQGNGVQDPTRCLPSDLEVCAGY